MPKETTELKIGDRVISLEDGKEGTVSRVCSDPSALFIKWDESPTQQRMVEVATLRKLDQ